MLLTHIIFRFSKSNVVDNIYHTDCSRKFLKDVKKRLMNIHNFLKNELSEKYITSVPISYINSPYEKHTMNLHNKTYYCNLKNCQFWNPFQRSVSFIERNINNQNFSLDELKKHIESFNDYLNFLFSENNEAFEIYIKVGDIESFAYHFIEFLYERERNDEIFKEYLVSQETNLDSIRYLLNFSRVGTSEKFKNILTEWVSFYEGYIEYLDSWQKFQNN